MARIVRPILVAAALVSCACAAGAQVRPCSYAPDSDLTRPAWSTPLDRPVTIAPVGMTLRAALDRLSAAAQVHISYSPDLLPLDRSVCLVASSTAIGTVLDGLLTGLPLSAIAGGTDQIVLAPTSANALPVTSPMATSLHRLDRVVVTGSATHAADGESAMDVDVITGQDLVRYGDDDLASALDRYVPGVWAWQQSPTTLVSSFGSFRGASSFGASAPKVYIDGIEVANPLLLNRIAPEAIDRIDVIRGPQGSALYGADAISGVINIVTKHDGSNADGARGSVESSAGMSQSAFAHGVVRQDHTVSLGMASSTESANFNVTGGSLGDFIPNGYSRDLTADASARRVGDRTTLSLTARYLTEQAGSARSPLLDALPAAKDSGRMSAESLLPQSLAQYTVGATGTLAAGRWTHSIVAGLDGYSLANVQTATAPLPSTADAALRDAEGLATRSTVRLSSSLDLADTGFTRSTFTFSADQTSLHDESEPRSDAPTDMSLPSNPEPPALLNSWQTSTGLGGEANVGFDNTVFLTAGLRLEQDSQLAAAQEFSSLPLLGVATVGDVGPFTFKVHASYGKGVRPPSTLDRGSSSQSVAGSSLQPSLGVEEQTGVEAGLDLQLRRIFALHITRYDQLASGLIQQVAVPLDSNAQSRRFTSVFENVGEISNRGWEIETSSGFDRLLGTATLSFVDSRVQKVADNYTGDLVEGARMLQVPAVTGGFSLSWLGDHWSAAAGGERALDWINYDEIALSRAVGNTPARDLVGARLRQYWREYNGDLRLHLSASRDLRDRLALVVQGDNLLNYQRGEPDNITIVPGRTITTGLRIKF